MKNEFYKRIFSSLILIPLSFYFIIKGSIFFNFFLGFCFLITSLEWYMMTNKKNYHIFGYIFLIFSFYTAYYLRNYDTQGLSSLFIFCFVLIICIATDIGGYILGKIFKGPRLTKISPNKTYSGMIGGYLFSLLSLIILIGYDELPYNDFMELTLETFVIVILISSVSQIGDITISFFKRVSKIKDTGKLIPGHGGILDRIDGMLFAFPFSYLLFSLNILK